MSRQHADAYIAGLYDYSRPVGFHTTPLSNYAHRWLEWRSFRRPRPPDRPTGPQAFKDACAEVEQRVERELAR